MGELTEMILDGTLCQGCRGFIAEGEGFPRFCIDCDDGQPDELQEWADYDADC